MGEHYKQLTYTERIQIETLLNANHSVKYIAEFLQRPLWTIQKEIKNNQYEHRRSSDWKDELRYSAQIGQMRHDAAKKKCGRRQAIQDPADPFLVYIEKEIADGNYSPESAIAEAKKKNLQFEQKVCANTIRNYIKKGNVFPHLTMQDLPSPRSKGKRGKKRKCIKTIKKAPAGQSIEKRPDSINRREEFGHWEMDTVVGTESDKKSVLVLTERKTRKELTRPLSSHTAEAVKKAIDSIERKIGTPAFRRVFKSITCDNGPENSDWVGLESSYRKIKKKRTSVFYCHPYRASERGSNENLNKMVRRWIPKKTRIDNYDNAYITKIGKWISEYPRPMFNWKSSQEIFDQCCMEEIGYLIDL